MKVLLARVTHIGDLVLATPVLRALDVADCEVHVLAGAGNQAVLQAHPHVDRLWVFDKRRPGGLPGLLWRLRRERFDAWIDPTDDPSTTSQLLARAGGARVRIGCNTGFRRPAFTHGIPAFWEDPGPHAVDRALRCLEPLGVSAAGRRPVLGRPGAVERRMAQRLHALGVTRYALVNLSAGHEDRLWPAQRWLAWFEAVAACMDHWVLIHMPREAPTARAILERFPQVVHMATDGIQEAAALVRGAAVVVSPDTSLVHVASAFDVPTVALYANRPLFHCRYLPLARRHQAVIAPREGDPVAAIPVAAVVSAWDAVHRDRCTRLGT